MATENVNNNGNEAAPKKKKITAVFRPNTQGGPRRGGAGRPGGGRPAGSRPDGRGKAPSDKAPARRPITAKSPDQIRDRAAAHNAEKQDEHHYKTIFYLIFTLATDYCVRTEQCSAAGRCDALIETEDTIYLFEFKLNGTAEEALKQIDDKGYAIQYEAGDKKIVKIGANFDGDKRTIERWIIDG